MQCLSPPDQEGWLGEFSGGLDYPLLWKEGEVYLLPLTEEDTGFYKAPGESARKIIEIWMNPQGQIVTAVSTGGLHPPGRYLSFAEIDFIRY